MPVEISFSKDAEKFLSKLDAATAQQVYDKIQHLKLNPKLGKPLGNKLKNQRRIRIGKYRAIYCIQGNGILITKIGHRGDVYRLFGP